MNVPDLERRLAQTPLPDPPGPLRAQVLARAGRTARSRRIGRLWRWALVVTTALLIVINLRVGQVREQRMAALLGPPAVGRALDTAMLAQGMAERQRLLIALYHDAPEAGLKEDSL